MMIKIFQKFKPYYSYICTCAALIVIHLFIVHSNDDLAIRDTVLNNGGSAVSIAIQRYLGWEGSWFSQLIVCLVAKYLWCFKIFNIAICMFAVWSLSQLFASHTSKENAAYIAAVLFLLYPLGNLSTAGWAVTCTVYLWVTVFAMYALTITQKVVLGEPVRRYEYILGIFALLYGSNREQSSLLLTLLFAGILIYCIMHKKKCSYIAIQLIISVANMASILLAPGTVYKNEAYVVKLVPDIETYSFVKKFYMVLSETMNYFLVELKIPILLFAIVLLILTLKRTSRTINRLIAIYPVFYIVLANMNPFSRLSAIFAPSGIISLDNASSIKSYIPIIMQLLWIGCVVATLWTIFNNTVHFWLLMLVLTAGMASKMAVCVSNAVVSSGNRTYVFMFFSILYCLGYALCYEKKLLNSKVFRWFMNILVALTIINLILALRVYGGFIPHWIDKY